MKKILAFLKNKVVLQTCLSLFTLTLIVGGVIFYFKKEGRIYIENCQVNAPFIPLSSSQTGKLKSILVVEGQKVKKGDIVAVIGNDIVRTYIDGIVVETNKQIGALVSPQVALVKIISPNQMRINGVIDENKGLSKIKVGQPAAFTIDAFPGKTYWGYVDEIAQSAKQTQLVFSISSERPTQQFDIFIRFDTNKYPEIKNGMSAKAYVYIK